MSTGHERVIAYLRSQSLNRKSLTLEPRDVVAVLAAIDERDAEIEHLTAVCNKQADVIAKELRDGSK